MQHRPDDEYMACLDFYATLESSKVIAKDSFCTSRLFDSPCEWMSEVPHNNVTCTSPGYISGVLCLKQGSRAGASNYIPQILQDVITCLCTWYLLSLSSLKQTIISHLSWFSMLVTCRWTCITRGVLLTPNDALKLNPFSQEKLTKHQRKNKNKTKRYHLLYLHCNRQS